MWLEIAQADANPLGQASEGANLKKAQLKNRLFTQGKLAPAELFAVGITRMRAYMHAMPGRQLERGMRRRRIAGVEAATDIGGGNERHQLWIAAAAFPQVAVQVEVHIFIQRLGP
jgi:hypothetical protein